MLVVQINSKTSFKMDLMLVIVQDIFKAETLVIIAKKKDL